MYAPAGDSTSADEPTPALAAVAVARIGNRPGQELRAELRDTLNPGRIKAEKRYELNVSLYETTSEFAVERSGLATRANLRIDANYNLTDLATQDSMVVGSTRVTSSYNIGSNPYSNVTAENAARTHAVQRIAENIRHRLAAYFSDRPQPSPPLPAAPSADSEDTKPTPEP